MTCRIHMSYFARAPALHFIVVRGWGSTLGMKPHEQVFPAHAALSCDAWIVILNPGSRRACARARVRARACARVCVCVCAWARAGARMSCVFVCMCVYQRACVCICVRGRRLCQRVAPPTRSGNRCFNSCVREGARCWPPFCDHNAQGVWQRRGKTVSKHCPFLRPLYGPDFGPDPRTHTVSANKNEERQSRARGRARAQALCESYPRCLASVI